MSSEYRYNLVLSSSNSFYIHTFSHTILWIMTHPHQVLISQQSKAHTICMFFEFISCEPSGRPQPVWRDQGKRWLPRLFRVDLVSHFVPVCTVVMSESVQIHSQVQKLQQWSYCSCPRERENTADFFMSITIGPCRNTHNLEPMGKTMCSIHTQSWPPKTALHCLGLSLCECNLPVSWKS